MDIFRTIVDIPGSKVKIDYKTPVLFMGSCFTENIGNKLVNLKFNASVNPFGVLYNPLSIKSSLEILMDKRLFTETDLFHYDDLWHSFYHHSKFSDTDVSECLQNINNQISLSSDLLSNAKFLFITLGTAWVFEKTDTGQIVSNCHKLPSKFFNRFLLGKDEIITVYTELITRIHDLYPNLQIVFTVSPIRHWKDGAVNNQISKSTLLLSIAELNNKFDFVSYFPAYEIVMDELRDYRFYAQDMLHINTVTTDYIWNRFADTYFESATKEIISDIDKIIKAKNHKPFKRNTKTYTQFLEANISKIRNLQNKYSYLILDEELAYFESQRFK